MLLSQLAALADAETTTALSNWVVAQETNNQEVK
jgi:hypothetical protein